MQTSIIIILLLIIQRLIHNFEMKHEIKKTEILTKMIAFEKTQDSSLFPELQDLYFFFYLDEDNLNRPTALSDLIKNPDLKIFTKKEILKIIKSEPDILVVNLLNQPVELNNLEN